MEALRRSLGFDQGSDPPPPSHGQIHCEDSSALSSSLVIVDRVGAPPVLEELPSRTEGEGEEDGSSQLQMRDRLANMWNNMKFSKTLWSLEASAAGAKSRMNTRLSPAWLLGHSYHKTNPSSQRSSLGSDLDAASAATSPDTLPAAAAAMTPLMEDFHSKLWMTYRKGFECFPKTQIDSDCGWGCMIRAGQMLVANTLIDLHLGRHWRWNPSLQSNGVITGDEIHNEALHRDIVRLFADQSTAPLSIHKIVEMGQTTINARPGDWFGPGSTAHLLRQALDSALVTADHPQVSELLNLRIYVSTDGTVFKQDVADLGIGSSNGSKAKVNPKRRKEQLQSCTKAESTPPKPIVKKASAGATEEGYSVVNTPHEESFEVTPEEVAEEAVMLDDSVRGYSLSQQVSVDGETWVTEEYSAPIVHQVVPPPPPTLTSINGVTASSHHQSDSKPSLAEKPPDQPNSNQWTPVLILVPVRLGSGDKVNRIYGPHVKNLLTSELCVGIIGGRPKHALYFMGFQEDNLIHLDPHVVQDRVNADDPDFDLSTYHCRSIRKMALSKMDPSCCLGFLCRTQDAFDEWCTFSTAQTDYPIYCVMEGRVSDHLADGEKFLNQMSMPEDEENPDGAVGTPGPESGGQRRNSVASASSDPDDFVIL